MILVYGLIAFVLGAFGRRIVGGLIGDLTGWPPPGLLAKYTFGLLASIGAGLGGMPWLYVPLLALGVMIGHLLHGMADTKVGSRMWFVWSGLYGIQVSIWFVGAALWFGHWAWFVPLFEPVFVWAGYLVGVRIAKPAPGGWRLNPWIGNGLPFGELIVGGFLGLLGFLAFAL